MLPWKPWVAIHANKALFEIGKKIEKRTKGARVTERKPERCRQRRRQREEGREQRDIGREKAEVNV